MLAGWGASRHARRRPTMRDDRRGRGRRSRRARLPRRTRRRPERTITAAPRTPTPSTPPRITPGRRTRTPSQQPPGRGGPARADHHHNPHAPHPQNHPRITFLVPVVAGCGCSWWSVSGVRAASCSAGCAHADGAVGAHRVVPVDPLGGVGGPGGVDALPGAVLIEAGTVADELGLVQRVESPGQSEAERSPLEPTEATASHRAGARPQRMARCCTPQSQWWTCAGRVRALAPARPDGHLQGAGGQARARTRWRSASR